jgi:hypothetical protein
MQGNGRQLYVCMMYLVGVGELPSSPFNHARRGHIAFPTQSALGTIALFLAKSGANSRLHAPRLPSSRALVRPAFPTGCKGTMAMMRRDGSRGHIASFILIDIGTIFDCYLRSLGWSCNVQPLFLGHSELA